MPLVESEPDSVPARAFTRLAEAVHARLEASVEDDPTEAGGIFKRFRRVRRDAKKRSGS